jgi:hypothetical protein
LDIFLTVGWLNDIGELVEEVAPFFKHVKDLFILNNTGSCVHIEVILRILDLEVGLLY